MRTLLPSVVWLGLVAAACGEGGRTPTRPAEIPRPASPAPQPSSATYTVSGVVRTTGNTAVAGARVVVLGQESAFATTDGDGRYSISGVSSSPTEGMAPLLSAAKTGFFTDVRFADSTYVPISRDAVLDFALEPLVLITVGEVVRGQSPIGPGVCSHWGYGEGWCQRFGVTAPATGLLDVTISAPIFAFDVDVVGPDGTFVLYDASWVSPLRLAIPVQAGSTYEIRVIGGWDPPREFELLTAMR